MYSEQFGVETTKLKVRDAHLVSPEYGAVNDVQLYPDHRKKSQVRLLPISRGVSRQHHVSVRCF